MVLATSYDISRSTTHNAWPETDAHGSPRPPREPRAPSAQRPRTQGRSRDAYPATVVEGHGGGRVAADRTDPPSARDPHRGGRHRARRLLPDVRPVAGPRCQDR